MKTSGNRLRLKNYHCKKLGHDIIDCRMMKPYKQQKPHTVQEETATEDPKGNVDPQPKETVQVTRETNNDASKSSSN